MTSIWVRLLLATALFVLAACPKPGSKSPPPTSNNAQGSQKPAAPSKPAATPEAAKAFIEKAEKELLGLWIHAERTAWVKSTYITSDTELIASKAYEQVMARTGALAQEATRFASLKLPDDVARKFKLLKLSLSLPAPNDAKKRAKLAKLATELSSMYGKGKFCSKDAKGKQTCRDLGALSKTLAKSRNYDDLLEAWKGWRTISVPMRSKFVEYVELANAGAKALGFKDLGALWKSRFDMDPDAFEKEVDRLWGQVKPLYQDLHCYARRKLRDKYGDKVPAEGPLPAHLMGNMWGQDWANIQDILLPKKGTKLDLEAALRARNTDEKGMVRYGEGFFVSLGMTKLPETFWKRSMFTKPKDREVVCHASAWDVDWIDDLRIKMCIQINGEDFGVIHHELGHNYYQYYYRDLDPLFRDSANSGFHEGLGDTIALSVTPSYLKKLGLIKKDTRDEISLLMSRALEKVVFLPFGVMIDKWRWDVFSGKTPSSKYNTRWWELRKKYQGIAPPEARNEQNFDPGAKFHIPANVPYVRYFLAHILQFQFHRALCKLTGHSGPVHECSIYGNKEAGKRLIAMMKMGQSKPWPEALKALTGNSKMDATAILDYFKPLHEWLKKQNKGQKCGW